MTSQKVDPPRDSDKHSDFALFIFLLSEWKMVCFTSTSVRPFTVLTEDDGVPGSNIEKEPENYTVDLLKRWLKCRGLKQSGKRNEIVQRVSDCLKGPNHRILDVSMSRLTETNGLQPKS